MPLITNTDLQAIGDKLARFASEAVGDVAFNAAFNAGMEAASANIFTGANSVAQYILDGNDEQVTADLLPAARDLDETHPTPPDGFLIQITSVKAMITALTTHLKRYGSSTGLDDYLTQLNASTPTLRFHGHFKDYLKTLSRGNAFIPKDTELARITVTGAAAGTFLNVDTITKYAGAQLKVKNVGAVTTGATLTVTGKKLDGTTQVITATIATGTDAFETALSSTAKLFTDVTAITISGATAPNVYAIVAKTDRDISAA